MKRFALLPLIALLVTVGCQDLQRDRLAPTEVAAPAPSLATSAAESEVSASSSSTVCVAYGSELTRVSTGLSENPNDAGLQTSKAALEAIIADACN